MKQMSRDPLAAARARKAERRADEKSGGITIKPVSIPSISDNTSKTTSGFKKGGFKNAFGDDDDEGGREKEGKRAEEGREEVKGSEEMAGEGEEEGEWGDYDPRRPTGCGVWCEGRDRGRV